MNTPRRLLLAVALIAALPTQADDRQELCGAIGQLAGSAAQARDNGIDLDLAQKMFGAIATKAMPSDADADTKAAYSGLVHASVGAAYEAKDVPPDLVKALANHSCLQALAGNDQ